MKRHILCLAIAGVFASGAQAAQTDATAASNVAKTTAMVAAQTSATDAAKSDDNQTAAERDKATQLESMTVTARRHSENIEKVPVAISAFSSDDLKDIQADDIDGLQGAVPNLNIVQGRGSSGSVNIFIRGIGQPDALQTFDPGVGFYVDDVYYSRIQGELFNLFDVERIEVLRGPQGTLYGKNSTGGAVKIITRQPGETPQGSIELTAGNYGRLGVSAYASGPLSNTVSASVAAAHNGNDGYVTDPVTKKHYNDEDSDAIRGKIDFHPSDRFHATLAADYTHQDTALTLGEPTAPLVSVDLATGAPAVLLLPPTGKYDFKSQTSFSPDKGQTLTHKGMALHMDWQLNSRWDFKSITAYRKLDTSAYVDIDASQFQLGDVLVELRQHQTSQEFQFQYDNGANVHAVYGLYYLDERVPSHQEAYADDFLKLAGAPLSFLRTIDDDLQNKSYAGFAHVAWEIVPSWSLATGLRYTHETKDYDRTTSSFYGAPLSAANATFAFSDNHSWSAMTPSISLQKQFDAQVMGYVSANRGFKSGGFNGRANSAAEVSTFNPEFVWTYEAGLKMRSSDGRAQLNADVFHSDYKDFQARVSEITNPDNPIPSFSFPVLNAAKLSINGIEFEGAVMLGEGTRLSAQIGYADAKYDKFNDPRTAVDPTLTSLHAHVPFSPKWTGRVAATQTFNLSGGSAITIGGDVSYRDDTWLSVDNRPNLMQPAYTLIGMFGLYDSADGHWQLRAGVRNLTDKVYKTDGQEFSSVANIQTAYFGWPRNYYVSARYNF